MTAVVSWLVATAAASLLVAGGVGAIRDTTRRDTVLAAATAAPPGVAPGRVGPTTTGPLRAPTSIVSTTTPGSAAGTGATTTTNRASSAVATTPQQAGATVVATSPGAPTTLPAVAVPSVALVDGQPPPTTTAAATTALTLAAQGGVVTIRYSATSVTVIAATPVAGRAAKVDQRGATAVRVEFEGGGHRSRIEAWWDNGPRQDVRED